MYAIRSYYDDQIPFAKIRYDGFRRCDDRSHICKFVLSTFVFCKFIFIKRCWHCDQKGICLFGLGRNGQITGFDGRFDDCSQTRFVDVDFARITSYNVCYTKLLRAIFGMLLLRLEQIKTYIPIIVSAAVLIMAAIYLRATIPAACSGDFRYSTPLLLV